MASFQSGCEKGRRLTRSDLNYDQSAAANCEEAEGKVLEEWERFEIL
jgi:hypothetical protein